MNHPFLQSELGNDPVILEATFNASVNRLFQAWTTEDDLIKWFGADEGGPEHVTINLRPGGIWKVAFAETNGQQDILSGQYLEIETNKKLIFTWTHTLVLDNGENETSPESTVSLDFKAHGKGSYLKLVHKAISTESARNNIGGGWDSSLSKLKSLIE